MDPVARMYQKRDEDAREAVRNYKKPPVRFRASELADCKRQIFYRLSGYVPKPRYGFNDDWGIDGDVHHDIVRQQLLNWDVRLAGITQLEDGSTEEDRFITHDFDVDGRIVTVSTRQDGWIYHEDYGWMMLEIKSVGHWPQTYMQKAYTDGYTTAHGVELPAGEDAALAYIIDKKPDYIAQINIGLAIHRARSIAQRPFPDEERYTLDHAFLILKDRSNCHIGYHPDNGMPVLGGIVVPYDQANVDHTLRRLYITKGKVTDGVPPLPEYPAGSKQCGYCPFKYACHDADKRRKQGLSPAVVYPDPAVGIHFDEDEVTSE
jgi:CRISPR/Cas system-associated exonuclease Cas4 (RecB family)